MVLKTRLTEMLGIQHPIIQGGMNQVSTAELVAGVSNAGGLGLLSALTQPSPEALRKEIQRTRTLTDKPFGVNLTVLPMLIPAPYDEYMNVICEEKVALVEIAGGNPAKYMQQCRDAGVKVLHKSATLKHALKAEKIGVDLIEIAGYESGIAGRASDDDVGTWVLLAKALSKLKTPVVVSGGSGLGRQLAAALSLGAVGITMGTRFLATAEAPIHENVKKFIAEDKNDEFSTVLVLRSFSNATRVVKNPVSEKILELEKQGVADFSQIQPLASGQRTKAMFRENGDPNDSMWSIGQSIGLVEDVPTCKQLLERMVKEAEEQLEKAHSTIVRSKL